MAEFDQSKAYAEQEEVFFDDGRELELLHFVYGKPDIEEIRGNPQKVLAAIDEFARTKKYLMNVGEDKGKIVTELISEVKPETMVELGGYIGYSCVLYADAVRKAGGKRYFSLERDPVFGAVISSLVDLAGLGDFVKVIIGSSAVSIKRLHTEGTLKHIDMMFLDHYKPAYKTDLKLCEELKLVTPGTVLAADNVIKPGNPPYLEYVRSSVAEKRKAAEESSDESNPDARFADRTAKQYANRQTEEKLQQSRGNPNLIYESKLVNSYEPSGTMLTAESSRFAHALQNVKLIVLSFFFLPLDTFILFFSYAVRILVAFPATSHRARVRSTYTRYFEPRTVLVTGVGMTKGLVLARLFFIAGHNVIGADFEPPFLPITCGHVSRSIKAFHRLAKPDGTREGSSRYCQSILDIVRKEKVDLWVSCSGVASAVEDGQAKEMVELLTKCKAVQYNVATTQKLHEKHSFTEYTKSLGLTIPETHTITSKTAALRVLEDVRPSGKKFIMKFIGTDDSVRGDMTLLPFDSVSATKAHISRLQISESRPWILQQFIDGPEYCTHALVVRGEVKAFTACPSAELLMHYEALSPDSSLSRSMLRFTQEYAASDPENFTGHLSFDFLVDRKDAERAQRDPNMVVTLYPIECNPRAHTAVALFNNTPEMIEKGYMSLLEEPSTPSKEGTNGASYTPPVYPHNPGKYYWIGHDLTTFVILPALSLFKLHGNSFVEAFEHFGTFLEHLFFWK
ncbi:putative O-methyltransferase, partial [Aureobasidium melanogenum]